MGIKIIDGHGNGYETRVDSEGRLFIIGVAETPIQHASMTAKAYIVSTPTITLTTASASGILYLKNTDPSRTIVLQELRTFLGGSNSSGDVILQGYKNVTTGTLVSSGTTITPLNQNLGSTIPSVSESKYGAEGSTITDGTEIIGAIIQDKTSAGVILDFAIPNGASFATKITPPSGNTSMKVRMRISFFYDELHVNGS